MSIDNATLDLITKYLSGKATPDEAMAVDAWMNIDPTHREYIFTLENHLPSATSPAKIGIAKHIVRNEIQLSVHAHRPDFVIFKIAAAIWLFILASGLLYFSVTGTNNNGVQIIKTNEEVKSHTLIDQSTVTVNRNSSLQWDAKYNTDKRKVALQGEAYFDVSHNPTKPFILDVNGLQIKVLGTSFNVLEDPANHKVSVSVTKGSVMMKNDLSHLIVKSGMKGIYLADTKQFTLQPFENKNETAYATHSIIFVAADFKEVTLQLTKAYGVTCQFNEADFTNCTLTTQWSDKSLPFVLNVIAEALNIQYKQEGKQVYFYGKGCQ
jgi:transmembrane sensor